MAGLRASRERCSIQVVRARRDVEALDALLQASV